MSDLLNSASLVMIPSGYKEDTIYSVVPSDGSGDLSFTRASNGTRVNSAGLVEVVPWNYVQNSENFGAIWLPTDITLTSGITAPNGTATAYTIANIAASGIIQQAVTLAGLRSVSIYAKQGTHRYLYLGAYVGSGTQSYQVFDLQTGTITSGSSGLIENVGGGWYRCTSFGADGTTGGVQIFPSNNASGAGTTNGSISIWGCQLNIGSTAKPYFPTTDRLNVPRLTYQNGGGGCPSLLLEKQSTNLYFPSTPNNSANGTYVANAGISPDGTQNAPSFTPSGFSVLYSNTITTTAQSYTWSVYLKGTVNGQKVKLGSDVTTITEFTLTTDWARYSVTFTASATTYGYYIIAGSYFSPAENNLFYTWGSQIEASSYATSLIPTTSSSATRVADECSKTGISSLIGQSEGVLFADFKLDAYDSIEKWIAFLGGGSQYVGLYTTTGGQFFAEVADTAAQFQSFTYGFTVGTRYKLALAYKTNDFAFYVNGTQVATGNSGTVPTTSQLTLQYSSSFANLTSRTYNQIAVFPTRLTNAELAALTTI